MSDNHSTTLAHIDMLVANQQRAVRWYVWMATVTAVLGLVIFGGSLLWGAKLAGEHLKAILGIAGAFISTSSALPLREVLNCRDRLDVYRSLRHDFVRAEAEPAEVERIRTVIWGVIAKVAGG